MKLQVVSSLWGKLVLTQRWAAGAFCRGRLDGLLRLHTGLPAWGLPCQSGGLWGAEPTLLLVMSRLAASARPNGQCPGTPCSG